MEEGYESSMKEGNCPGGLSNIDFREDFQGCITNYSAPPTLFFFDLGQVTGIPAVLQSCIRFHITKPL